MAVRRRADEPAGAVTARTSEVAAQLVARGPSVRDVAALLGISSQRVSQLNAKAGRSRQLQGNLRCGY